MTTGKALRNIATGVLLLTSIFAIAADQKEPAKPAKLDLGGAERYSTFVSTDKPMYRPGEKMYVRAVILRADNRAPLAANQQGQQAMIEVKGPKGDVVAGGMALITDSVAGMSWQVPTGLAGGEYTIKVSHPWMGHVPGERKFDIRAYRAPRLKSQIVFVRDGYGPGDTANVTIHVDRAEGGVPENAKVTVVARVDGAEAYRGTTKIDAKGNASATFKLPAQIARGEGTLAWIIEDGGVLETATKTIPILLQTVDLSIYPEGGDLIAGLPNRVYIEAFTPAKKPADLKGIIVDGQGKEVAQLKTEHEGRGRFALTPAKGEKYTLKITEPAGIKTTYPLPMVKDEGVVLHTDAEVTAKGQPVKLSVSSAKGQKVKVTLSKREVEVAAVTKDLAVGAPNAIELTPPASADGVLIATVWDEAGKPLAERLVFRKPEKSVKVEIKADKSNYVPADAAKLTVTTTDGDGKPISAVVGVTVTDDSVLEMIEKREQSPRLPVMVLLEGDVKELADAHVYLDETNPKAPLATDLLLGTQGWRRFAFVDPTQFISQHGDEARRVLALRVVTQRDIAMLGDLEGFGVGAGGGPQGGDRLGRPRALAARGAEVDRNGAVDEFRAANAEDKALDAAKPAEAAPQDAVQRAGAAEAEKAPEAGLVAGGGIAAGRGFRELPKQQADQQLAQKLEEQQERVMAKRRIAGPGGGGGQAARNDFIAVREYAHAIRGDRKPNDRVDFAETLYWNAGVKTDAKTGQATIELATSDAVTSFRVFAEAFGGDGALGSSTKTIESVQPFYTEPKLPLQVTQGDVIRVPVSLVNGLSEPLAGTTLTAKAGRGITVAKIDPLDLAGKARVRRIVEVKVGEYTGISDFIIDAKAKEYTDKVTRKLEVKAAGFPTELAYGGLLGPDNSIKYELTIPQDLVANSMSSELTVFPTPLANMTQALEALIQQPSGCFEQTSSTSYPLVMAQQYFMSHQGVEPKLIEKSRGILDESYKRLIGFECKQSKGFEWFGADPGHEALSAYGLLQFTDMAIVREVDPRILTDTRGFILKTRDGKGGFKRERTTLHTWVTDPECSNGYILWALLESGEKPAEVEKEIAAFKELVSKSNNSYAIALGANVMFLSGDKAAAKTLMEKLAAKQNKDGFVDGATQSVIGSGGDALNIEATSLASLAWMREPAFAMNVEKAMKYLADSCKGGRYGSTQSTVLALRAIVTYDKMRARPKNSGVVRVVVDGNEMGNPADFSPETQGAIQLQNIAEALAPGKHTIELKMDRGSQMPFAILVKFNRVQPDSSDKCKVDIAVSLKDKQIVEGNVTEANVTVTNKDKEVIPTPIAIVGIPGGLEVRHDQLKELVKSGKIAAYEVIGREVVLYWRELKGNEKVELPLSLIAAIPGQYTAPASRAYLYYTDEFKQWVAGVSVDITPKDKE